MKCKCNLDAKIVTVKKEGQNKGRQFYACAKPQNEQCDFFEWADTKQVAKQMNEDNRIDRILVGVNAIYNKLQELEERLKVSGSPQENPADSIPFN